MSRFCRHSLYALAFTIATSACEPDQESGALNAQGSTSLDGGSVTSSVHPAATPTQLPEVEESSGPQSAEAGAVAASSDASQTLSDAEAAALDAATPDSATFDAGTIPVVDASADAGGGDACVGSSCAQGSPYDVGISSVDGSWTVFVTQPGQLYLAPIVAPRRARLKAFKLRSRVPSQQPQGGVCRFALYTDLDNRPHDLLTWSFVNASVADGESSVAAGSTAVRLAASTKYWIGAECDQPVDAVRIVAKPAQEGQALGLTHDFGSSFADPVPGAAVYQATGHVLALYVEVQDVP